MSKTEDYIYDALYAFRRHFTADADLKQIAGAVAVRLDELKLGDIVYCESCSHRDEDGICAYMGDVPDDWFCADGE